MDGSVYQRKDGRWVGVVDAGKTAEGKRKQKYIYGKTKKAVQIKLNNLVYELQNNIYRDPNGVTMKNYLEEWYQNNRDTWEETTASLYRMYLNKHITPSLVLHLLSFYSAICYEETNMKWWHISIDFIYSQDVALGNIKLKDLLPMHIETFYNVNLKESSSNTVIKYHALLHKALDYAVKNKLILTNPSDSVEKPKKVKYTPKIYNEEQFAALLKHVEGTFDEIPILLTGACGLRRGEIFGLRWCDIDAKNKTLNICQTYVRFDKNIVKGTKNVSSNRIFRVPDFIFPVLESYKKQEFYKNKEGIISVDPNQPVCSKYKPQAYSERFTNLVTKFELPKIRLHDLRHFNAVIMMKYNVPDKVAAQRLGHSNTQTLREVYQHVLTDMDEDAANKINILFMDKA